MKNASESKLLDLIAHNLSSLENIIDYNIKNNIKLFRISSDIIPFGSSPVNKLPWWELFADTFSVIGRKIENSNMRVSMHPGQYTVLNSPHEEVVGRAIEDLNYHNQVLDSLSIASKHKIVLHIGGIYNDKEQAMKRFSENYDKLSEGVKRRLVIENDDKSYTIRDVLEISSKLNVPVIYDNLHNKINPFDQDKSDRYWIDECRFTWTEQDGNQKVHYSQQDIAKKRGSHSKSIDIDEFMNYYELLGRKDLDIMLEVKDKNLSAIKCINCTTDNKKIKTLELEWSRYKYSILEKSPTHYLELRKLLRDKNNYPGISFYHLIEDALQKESNVDHSINAAQHVWGYFKDTASEKEKNNFLKSMEKYKQGMVSLKLIKNILWKLTLKYNQLYLVDSYYFVM